MPITVKTAVYEGPLDLLLELIEKKKLLINDISLTAVADEFISYVQKSPELPVGETAEFVTLAATLLLIKSRSLLPSLTLSDEESQDIRELEYRLAVYQIIKEASRELGRIDSPELHEIAAPESDPIFAPDPSATPQSLRAAAQTLIEGFPTTLALPRVEVKKIVSLEEMIERMASRISQAFKMSFREFSKGGTQQKEARQTLIVSFLALLELVKQGIIKATQEGDDIRMESDAPGTPTYGD